MNKERGFIFIFTLWITAVISLLVLSSMQQVMLYQRAASMREREHQHFYQLEHIARQLINIPKDKLKQCMRSQNLANQVLQQVLQKQGCSFTAGKNNYWYLVEDLGSYPCLLTISDDELKATQHFRFTILTPSNPEHSSSLVQIRVIRPLAKLYCAGEINYVATGISSWRYFSNVEMMV